MSEAETQDETEPTEPTEQPVTIEDELDEAEHAQPPEPVPDEADTQQQQASGEIPEKALRKIEQSFATYTASVNRNLEERALELLPCPLCPPMHPAFLNKNDAGRVPEEVKDAVLLFLGFAREQEYEPDPEAQQCSTCRGKGKTALPTKVAGKETRTCPACNGYGYTMPTGAVPAAVTNGNQEQNFTLADPTKKDAAEADEWGQPRILPDGRENPNWGRMPQYWVQVEPWGNTQNLTALDAPGS